MLIDESSVASAMDTHFHNLCDVRCCLFVRVFLCLREAQAELQIPLADLPASDYVDSDGCIVDLSEVSLPVDVYSSSGRTYARASVDMASCPGEKDHVSVCVDGYV